MSSDINKAISHLKKELDKSVNSIERILTRASIETVADAKTNLKDNVDTGALRASVSQQVKRNGDILEVSIGANTDYALFVHENPNLKAHKFLENAFLDNFSNIKFS